MQVTAIGFHDRPLRRRFQHPFTPYLDPQILLNHRSLVSNNSAALFAVPWIGMLTGLLGNLTLLSYFAKKKEKETILVETLGVLSIYIVIVQLAFSGAMPLPQFMATSTAVVTGLVLNFMNYYGWLMQWIWEDFITIVGISVLPQVMWSTFVPFIPDSILPGVVSCSLAVLVIILRRTDKLSKKSATFSNIRCMDIRIDCHSTLYVDACCSDVDKLLKT